MSSLAGLRYYLNMGAIRILLADDHPIVREGYLRLLERQPGLAVVAEAGDGETALAAFLTHEPDIVLMDLSMPGAGGLAAVEAILAHNPSARIIIVSMHQGAVFARKALAAGARGFVSKSSPPEELVSAIGRVVSGRRVLSSDVAQDVAQTSLGHDDLGSLTRRELEILQLLAHGMNGRAIARTLGLSAKTIQNNLSQVRAKLDASGDADLVLKAQRAGLTQFG
ncbi:response regulator [Roseibium aggregatum]|uniref:Response regulator transcription factor n=1 Tax=Roseibium aggregatum TaxID=187304 RepID=A0A939EEI2_9HYPH|nr:response regulator [Roseibium aggregatum]MBN9671493.1 response regulator transcription factor [Roseibium aggregatum]